MNLLYVYYILKIGKHGGEWYRLWEMTVTKKSLSSLMEVVEKSWLCIFGEPVLTGYWKATDIKNWTWHCTLFGKFVFLWGID